jgi:thiamine-monophosphate kinase
VKLRELGEFGFIDRIAARVKSDRSVAVGIGDDAASLIPTPGHVTLVTTDMLVAGVHFDLTYSDPYTLGKKTIAVNLSDLAAMGARPRHILLALAIPPELSLEFLDSLLAGIMEMADRYKVTLVGGDTCSSLHGLVLSVTAMGEQLPDRQVCRSGARCGDLVCVTGYLGDAAFGLEQLRRGERGGPAIFRHLDPEPRVEAGVALAEQGLATAMIDISDGLLADLGHICELSHLGARLELERFPLSDELLRHRGVASDGVYAYPLSGGEDYELLFTVAPERRAEVEALFTGMHLKLSFIGEMNGSGKVTVFSGDGSEFIPVGKGFNHFSS